MLRLDLQYGYGSACSLMILSCAMDKVEVVENRVGQIFRVTAHVGLSVTPLSKTQTLWQFCGMGVRGAAGAVPVAHAIFKAYFEGCARR